MLKYHLMTSVKLEIFLDFFHLWDILKYIFFIANYMKCN